MTLAEAYLAVALNLPIDPTIKARLDRAYDIVRTDGSGYAIQLPLKEGEAYTIYKESTSLLEDTSHSYSVSSVFCSCPDYPTARAGLCKHRLAIMMLEAMER